ncbi:MAG: aminotransferase class I/II-fold pyridoxal phosphate-dependent enzyme [Thermaerobacterales bacterium]
MTEGKQRHPSTTAVGASNAVPPNAPATEAIYQTTSFLYDDLDMVADVYGGEKGYYAYTREGHPNQRTLEEMAAKLDGAPAAAATSAGMAAITGACLACARAGDHIIAATSLYGGTYNLFTRVLPDLGITADLVDINDTEQVRAAVRDNTRIIYVETVSNPIMRVTDLEAVVDIARSLPARPKVVVDNTFATPYACQAPVLGVDLAAYSLSKFMSGHNDLIAGVVTGDQELIEKIRSLTGTFGWAITPFNAWLALRGIRTLWVRMERATATAGKVAAYLNGHARVERVHYPGLSDHPDHEIAQRVLQGNYGAMVGFEAAGGQAVVDRILKALEIIRFTPTLGGVTSNVSHPATTSHRWLPADERRRAGIADGLLRLSIGLEEADDLIADLDQALSAAAG